VIGTCAGAIVAILTIWLTLRKQARQPARELLAGEIENPKSKVQSPKAADHSRTPRRFAFLLDQRTAARSWSAAVLCRFGSLWIALASGFCAVVTVGWALFHKQTANAEIFFSAGSLLLIAGIAAASSWIKLLARSGHPTHLTLANLGLRGCARRGKRSL